MCKYCTDKQKQIFRQTGAYLFLYTAFAVIFYNYAYYAWLTARPIGLMLVFFKTLIWLAIYAIINHLLMKEIVGLKTVLLFEIILFVLLLVLPDCYAAIENRNHDYYLNQTSYFPISESLYEKNDLIINPHNMQDPNLYFKPPK